MIRSILFVDDDPVTVALMKTQLELNGYPVVTAVNGRQALDVLARHAVDLVITDVVMPEMDGVDLYQALKANERTAYIPIMIVTDQPVFIESFTALGVEFFITKSSPIEDLLAKIREIDARHLSDGAGIFHKVIIGAVRPETVEQMSVALRQKNCLVSGAVTSLEIISKSFLMSPDLIIVDVALQDAVSVHELIRALRCFDFLKKTRLILFTDFTPDQNGNAAAIIEGFKSEIDAALEAGATQYIGRFSRLTFIEQLASLGLNNPGDKFSGNNHDRMLYLRN